MFIIVFYMLQIVADRFLCPCLAEICKRLHLSQGLAGVTFLAFGNGANDVLSAFAAGSGKDEDGVYISMGAILGSCLLVTTVVCSVVVLLSKTKVIMNQNKFTRDLLVLLGSIVLLLIYSFIGFIHWVMALLFLFLYASFVGYVIYTEVRSKKQDVLVKLEEQHPSESGNKGTVIMDKDDEEVNSPSDSPSHASKPAIAIEDKKSSEASEKEESFSLKKIWKDIPRDLKELCGSAYFLEEYHHMSAIGKFLHYFVGGHFEFILRLSIPPFDKNKWDRRHAVLFPIFGSLLTFIQMRIFSPAVLAATIITSIVASVIIYLGSERKKAPSWLIIFMFIGFIQSVQWMWFLCNISVDLFKLLVELTDVEPTYVGLTFMSCANSIGDIVSDTTMAKLGYSVMAITAAFAGPIFNIMLGMGITVTRSALKSGGMIDFNIKEIADFTKGNMLMFVALFINILAIGFILYSAFKNKFELKRYLAFSNIGIYIVFFVIVSILTIIMQMT